MNKKVIYEITHCTTEEELEEFDKLNSIFPYEDLGDDPLETPKKGGK